MEMSVAGGAGASLMETETWHRRQPACRLFVQSSTVIESRGSRGACGATGCHDRPMPDLETSRRWWGDGERAVALAMEQLTDDDLRKPSRLPGWTRAHVVAHLARNADALINLCTWARTGVET